MSSEYKPVAPVWPPDVRLFIIDQLAAWKTKQEIYDYVTSKDFEEETGMTAINAEEENYRAFAIRCGMIPKRELAKAHDDWTKRYDDIRWADQKARVEGMSDLIDKLMKELKEDPARSPDLLAQARLMMEQIRKEMSADADRAAQAASGTKIFLHGGSIEFTSQLVGDLIMVIREEYGGLHNMNLNVLSIEELEKLITKTKEVRNKKLEQQEVDTDYEIIEEEMEDDEDETI